MLTELLDALAAAVLHRAIAEINVMLKRGDCNPNPALDQYDAARAAIEAHVAELSAERDELSTACHDLIIAIQEGDSEPVSEIVRAWSAVSAVEARRK